MTEAEGAEHAQGGRSGARADFVASIGRRLAALRASLRELEAEPRSTARREMLVRRLHALSAAARVLEFAEVADALARAEQTLQRGAASGETRTGDIADVQRALEQVPSLMWGAKLPTSEPDVDAPPVATHPLCVLVCGPPALAAGLSGERGGVAIEVEIVADDVADTARALGPDAIVIDADRHGAKELVDELLGDPLIEPFALIVIGSFERPEAASAFVARGAARVLPKPPSPEALYRAVTEVSRQNSDALLAREAIGDVTVDELAARITAEVRRGLVDAAHSGSRSVSVPFGDGVEVLAAVWGAVARVREIATMRSAGVVRFDPSGPEGAIPLAPWTSADRRAGERAPGTRLGDGVALTGRRAVVVDDDPAVVWFIAGLLRTAGMEVIEAHDGTRAYDLTVAKWPDVLISDVLMPGVDGFALCRAVKRDIAVRDVPVILLSWKEDLLQRVRELGANADGYLRKEATASTVLQRVREVLRPRARVEARLASGEEVRGRLDGLTPRLVLSLACERHTGCRVAIRDAAYLYEVEIRESRPFQATRTASDGSFERGDGVIAALLGITAGRFVVTPAASHCRDRFEAPLDEVLAPHIRRARAAMQLLSGSSLLRVDRVEIDEAAIAAYVAATPNPAHELVQRLARGDSPRDLMLSGGVSPELMESTLADVTRHAGIAGIVRDGEACDLDAARPSAAPVLPNEVAVREVASPAAQFTLALSPVHPEAELNELDEDGWVAPPAPATELSARLPLDRNVTPPIAAAVPSFADEPKTFPGVGPVPAASSAVAAKADRSSSRPPPATQKATPIAKSSEPPAAKAPEPVKSSEPPAAKAPEPVKSSEPPTAKAPEPAQSSEPPAAELEPVKSSEPPAAEPEPAKSPQPAAAAERATGPDDAPVDLGAAVLDTVAVSPSSPPAVAAAASALPTVRRIAMPPRPSTQPAPPDAERPAIDDAALAESAANADAVATKSAADADAALAESAANADAVATKGAADEEQAVGSDASTIDDGPAELEGKDGNESAVDVDGDDGDESAAEDTEEGDRDEDASGDQDDDEDADQDDDENGAQDDEDGAQEDDGAQGDDEDAEEEDESDGEDDDDDDDDRRGEGAMLARGVERDAPRAARGEARLPALPKAKSITFPRDDAARAKKPAERPAERKAGGDEATPMGTLKIVGIMAIAGVASYALITGVRSALSGDAERPPVAAQSAEVPVAPPPTVAKPAAPGAAAPKIEELPLPPGVPLAADKGLLEIEIVEKDAIYVDGTFVGRGPQRRVPVDPGTHEVKLRKPGEDQTFSVDVKKGLRTRVSISAPGE